MNICKGTWIISHHCCGRVFKDAAGNMAPKPNMNWIINNFKERGSTVGKKTSGCPRKSNRHEDEDHLWGLLQPQDQPLSVRLVYINSNQQSSPPLSWCLIHRGKSSTRLSNTFFVVFFFVFSFSYECAIFHVHLLWILMVKLFIMVFLFWIYNIYITCMRIFLSYPALYYYYFCVLIYFYFYWVLLTLALPFAVVPMQMSSCGTNEGLIYSVVFFSVAAILSPRWLSAFCLSPDSVLI